MSEMSNLVEVFPDFLSKEVWDDVFFNYLTRPMWQYGHVSADFNETINTTPTYWSMDLNEEALFTENIFNQICSKSSMNFTLSKVYAGGNTYGTSGDVHVDSLDEAAYTFLYHASPDVWDPMYGGKTIFYPEGRPAIYHEFVPNQGLLFKSNILHMGEPTTKYFQGLRICIAFKLYVV